MLTNKSDHEIQQDVLRELEWQPGVRETDVGVTVKSGTVTLTGTVDSWAEKHAAGEASLRVHGVLDVANDIQIRPSWDAERTDTDIAQAVRRTLEWNVHLPDHVKSEVWNGVVKLSGTVETLRQREHAEAAIRVLKGVRGIENQIVVEPPRVNPEQLQTSIENALARHVAREARRIEVAVRGDTVWISGEVGTRAEHDAALGVLIGTRGVRAIEDQLRVVP